MAVKRSLSATRVLRVFEEIARAQPIGVSALVRVLDAEKSAIHRDVLTLADAGWIQVAPGGSHRWELTSHILLLARPPHSRERLRVFARPLLERVHAHTGETVYLAVPHQNHFVVLDAIDSPHVLRVVQPVGTRIPVERSATAKAFLAHVPLASQSALLGAEPSKALAGELQQVRQQGYALNDGGIVPGSVTIAAALLDESRGPMGAIVVSGPADRIRRERWPQIGRLLNQTREQALRTPLADPAGPD